jgi:hypothetical protein
MDSSFSKKINTDEWVFYDEDDHSCIIYYNEDNSKKKLAVKKIVGLFSNEIAYTFWNIDESVKLEWDQSVQSMKVLEVLSPNCAILHLKMKRIWPAKARDCVVCTELLQIGDHKWVVNNVSVDHPLTKNIEPEYTRMTCNINMFVEEELINKEKERTRDNVVSTITYKANVDVGNWVSNVIVKNMCHKTWSSVLEELCSTIRKTL